MDRFIISTGRSGSTLLSRMLGENRYVLQLSEFMSAMDDADRFQEGRITGEAFRRIISADDDLSALIAARGRPSKEALHVGVGSTVTATGRAPTLVRVTFPPLTAEPEALFEAASAFASRLPSQPIAAHYRALIEFLCARLGRPVWVERSGFGIRLFPGLRRCFPDAKFLHIHRDGIEAALSMFAHPWFRIGVYFDFDPPSIAEARRAIERLAPDTLDAVSQHYLTPPPIEIYGRHWSNVLARAYREMTHLGRSQYTELRFEDLVGATEDALRDLSAFFELPEDAGWISRAAGLVETSLVARAPGLTPEEMARLELACIPGQVLLGRAAPGRLDEALANLRAAFLQFKTEKVST